MGLSETGEPDKDALDGVEQISVEAAKESLDPVYNSGYFSLERVQPSLSERLAQFPDNEREAILRAWLVENRILFWDNLIFLGSLPESFQTDMISFVDVLNGTGYEVGLSGDSELEEEDGGFIDKYAQDLSWVSRILGAFDQITNKTLSDGFLVYADFTQLADNRSKLPLITDDQIMAKAPHKKETQEIDWLLVIPHISQLSTEYKKMAIAAVLASRSVDGINEIINRHTDLGLSSRELIDICVEDRGRLGRLVYGVENVEPQYYQEIAERAIELQVHAPIMQSAKRFKQVDFTVLLEKFADDFVARGHDPVKTTVDMIGTRLMFLPIEWIDQVPDELVDMIVDRYPTMVAPEAYKFGDRIDKDALIATLLSRGQFEIVFTSSSVLGLADLDAALMLIADAGGIDYALKKIPRPHDPEPDWSHELYRRLVELDPEKTYPLAIYFKDITKEDVVEVVSHVEFSNITQLEALLGRVDLSVPEYQAIAQLLIRRGQGYVVAQGIDTLFKGLTDSRTPGDEMLQEVLKNIAIARKIFGDHLSKEAYDTLVSIADGTIDHEQLIALGCSQTGEVGVLQLRQQLVKFKADIITSGFDTKRLEQPVLAQYYKSYVRIDSSEWGSHDDGEFMRVVGAHTMYSARKEAVPLPETYTPSGEVRVNKVDKQKQEDFKYSESFISRFETLRTALADSLSLIEEQKPLTYLVEQLDVKRTTLATELAAKLNIQIAQQANPKAIASLTDRLEKLKGVQLRSVRDWQESFSALAQFREFEPELREFVMYVALHKHRDQREVMSKVVNRSEPSFDDVSAMVNFISHIVNEQTWRKYFTDSHAMKAFFALTNLRALEEELVRAQQQDIKGTTPLQFVPTRGLLLEFSGHIADACWASRYGSIAETFPNFSAVIIVQNQGEDYERLAGASLFIEAEAQDGTPLLIIRGLNPIENVINSLDVKDFTTKFIEYAREQAEAAGRKLAVVIDSSSGQACTNRPVLFKHLADMKYDLEPIELASSSNTSFNGYDISQNIYLL